VSLKVVAFVQARMSSRRLPGKVLAPIEGKPMLARVLSRTCRARSLTETWVLTSEDASDEPIRDFCEELGIPCFRGSLDDVLDRFIQAASIADPEIIVRLTADCPLVDPEVIDRTVDALVRDSTVVYAATRMPGRRTFPVGIDIEVFRREALERSANIALEDYQREHVTPWFYDGSQTDPIVHVQSERDLGRHRWAVDTPEDLAFIRALWPLLPSDDAGYEEIADILEMHPELRSINAHVKQRDYRESGD
jgi:spore coat polysaccharide biosynthesis protein SpsF